VPQPRQRSKFISVFDRSVGVETCPLVVHASVVVIDAFQRPSPVNLGTGNRQLRPRVTCTLCNVHQPSAIASEPRRVTGETSLALSRWDRPRLCLPGWSRLQYCSGAIDLGTSHGQYRLPTHIRSIGLAADTEECRSVRVPRECVLCPPVSQGVRGHVDRSFQDSREADGEQ